jgi:uncharacterized protein (TIGR03437 family)
VRPGSRHLYFTSLSGTTPQTATHTIAWRYREYTTLERVVGAGDRVTVRLANNMSPSVTLSAAGPIDANAEGREFIYLESATSNVYGLFEIKPDGSYESIFTGRLSITRDTPWGMAGFLFNDGGLVFLQPGVMYYLDPNTKLPLIVALEGQEGQPFMPASVRYANLTLTRFFRPSNDPTTYFFNWGSSPGEFAPADLLSIWKDWNQTPFDTTQLNTGNATTAATFAMGDRVTVMGTGPRGPGTVDYDARITVGWPISTLWLNRGGAWTQLLRDIALPDSTTNAPKKFYQGVTAFGCQVEFATKRFEGSFDNGGPFHGFYRLHRPCIDSATFNTATRELIVRGVNLQDQRTELGVPPATPPAPGAPLGTLIAARVTFVSPAEVRATLDPAPPGLQNILVLVNGQVWSDPAPVTVTASPAPILRTMTDLNGDLTPAAPNKLMTLWGLFGCQTALTTSVNYPDTLGNCSVILENPASASPVARRLPLLYTSNDQINFLFPAGFPPFAYHLRVTRTDANGVFTSAEYITNSASSSPVAIRAGANVIVVVIRSGNVVVLGPNDPIRPGEYFTVYLTGLDIATLPPSVLLGETEAQYAAAVVSWAQGVVQVNVLAPPSPLGNVMARIGDTPPFPVRIQ